MIYYKILDDNKSCSGGNFDWSGYLPRGDKPGIWVPRLGEVKTCRYGYHATTAEGIIHFVHGKELYEVEVDGEDLAGLNVQEPKIVAKTMRLVRRVPGYNLENLRKFCIWCAKSVVKYHPNPSLCEEYIALSEIGVQAINQYYWKFVSLMKYDDGGSKLYHVSKALHGLSIAHYKTSFNECSYGARMAMSVKSDGHMDFHDYFVGLNLCRKKLMEIILQ